VTAFFNVVRISVGEVAMIKAPCCPISH
jgi:hypothetical protein